MTAPPLPLSPSIRRAIGITVFSGAAAVGAFLVSAHADAAPAKSKPCSAAAQRAPSPIGDLVVVKKCGGGVSAKVVRPVPPPKTRAPKVNVPKVPVPQVHVPKEITNKLPTLPTPPKHRAAPHPPGQITVLDVEVNRKGKVTKATSDYGPQSPVTATAGGTTVTLGSREGGKWNVAGGIHSRKATRGDTPGVHVPRFVTHPAPTPYGPLAPNEAPRSGAAIIMGETGGTGQGVAGQPATSGPELDIAQDPYVPQDTPQPVPAPQSEGGPLPAATLPDQRKNPATPVVAEDPSQDREPATKAPEPATKAPAPATKAPAPATKAPAPEPKREVPTSTPPPAKPAPVTEDPIAPNMIEVTTG